MSAAAVSDTAGQTVSPRDLMDWFGVNAMDLMRYRERGWIQSVEPVTRGGGEGHRGGSRTRFPSWAVRMCALIAHEDDAEIRGRGRPQAGNVDALRRRRSMFASVAAVLAADPEVEWVVFLDQIPEHPWPCHTAAEVVVACDRARTCATIVAVPW